MVLHRGRLTVMRLSRGWALVNNPDDHPVRADRESLVHPRRFAGAVGFRHPGSLDQGHQRPHRVGEGAGSRDRDGSSVSDKGVHAQDVGAVEFRRPPGRGALVRSSG